MKKKMMAAVGGIFLLLAAASCTASATGAAGAAAPSVQPEAPSAQPAGEQEHQQADTFKTRAMYVPYGKGDYILVDQENGTVFTVTMPEEIVGLSGERIAPDALQRGNILEITGNGIMLESYPGQYPGVTRIEVAEAGKPEDADQYQSIVDEIYAPPDLAEPPGLNIAYRTPLAAVSASITRGSYEWSFEDESGQVQTTMACGSHVLQWKEIIDLALPDATDLTLHFYHEAPVEVQVWRWPASQKDTQDRAVLDGGEAVQVASEGDARIIKGAQAGYIYLVTAKWERGTAQYGFQTE